ncbi:hypothetical protein DY000_02052962 [Brassica cretica]|uniref:Uncharacterized protein n=1 Tax=Brassica cretica TaxID=69181 RepID=A0ABQ7A5Q3_BRACR|nr:hypothetical protein DY000_02052962 [Brassica cretica]
MGNLLKSKEVASSSEMQVGSTTADVHTRNEVNDAVRKTQEDVMKRIRGESLEMHERKLLGPTALEDRMMLPFLLRNLVNKRHPATRMKIIYPFSTVQRRNRVTV